MDPRKMA